MTGPEALGIIDRLLEQHQRGTLKTIQATIVLQVWNRGSYQEIGSELGYEPEYIKNVAAQLWRLLSELVGTKVCKGNLCSILEGYQRCLTITDWGEAIDVSLFYGRQRELETLEHWILASRCRWVGIFGWGGIGKTALSVKLARRLESQFEYVVWRSLQRAPTLEDLLAEILPIFTAGDEQITSRCPEPVAGSGVERSRIGAKSQASSVELLMQQLRQQRCLLVLDNVESILQQGSSRCAYLPGYEAYGEMFDRISDERHRSCLILTGREKPSGMRQQEGVNLPVRSIQLAGLSIASAQHILIDKGLESPTLDQEKLISYVGGNPLALKLVATSIQNLFSGNIMAFLTQGAGVFSNLEDLLTQQFDRLSPLQQQVMYWLAIDQQGVTPAKLKAKFSPAITFATLLEALETLKDRSAIETTERGLTQQPVIMEYVIDRFIQQIEREIIVGELDLSSTYALIEPQTQDYLREAQIQPILQPLVDRLLKHFTTRSSLEQQLSSIYNNLLHQPREIIGYAAENLLDIFDLLQTDLPDVPAHNTLIYSVDATRSQLSAMESFNSFA
jgi:hypothetical protein